MTISVVQKAPALSSPASQSLGLTFGSPTTAGNLIAVLAGAYSSFAAETITGVTLGGSAGNFALARRTNSTTGLPSAEIWCDPSCAGGATAVALASTGGPASSAGIIGVAYEIAGLATSSPVDRTAGGTGTSGSWTSGSTAATSAASEIWLGVFAGFDAATGRTVTGAASPWTSETPVTDTGGGGFDTEYWTAGYRIVTSAAAASYAGSQNDTSGNMHWAVSVVTLLPAAGGGANPGAFLPFFP